MDCQRSFAHHGRQIWVENLTKIYKYTKIQVCDFKKSNVNVIYRFVISTNCNSALDWFLQTWQIQSKPNMTNPIQPKHDKLCVDPVSCCILSSVLPLLWLQHLYECVGQSIFLFKVTSLKTLMCNLSDISAYIHCSFQRKRSSWRCLPYWCKLFQYKYTSCKKMFANQGWAICWIIFYPVQLVDEISWGMNSKGTEDGLCTIFLTFVHRNLCKSNFQSFVVSGQWGVNLNWLRSAHCNALLLLIDFTQGGLMTITYIFNYYHYVLLLHITITYYYHVLQNNNT